MPNSRCQLVVAEGFPDSVVACTAAAVGEEQSSGHCNPALEYAIITAVC